MPFFAAAFAALLLVPLIRTTVPPGAPAGADARAVNGGGSWRASLLRMVRAAHALLRDVGHNRTLQLITLQGLFGAVPWQVFGFLCFSTDVVDYVGFGFPGCLAFHEAAQCWGSLRATCLEMYTWPFPVAFMHVCCWILCH